MPESLGCRRPGSLLVRVSPLLSRFHVSGKRKDTLKEDQTTTKQEKSRKSIRSLELKEKYRIVPRKTNTHTKIY